MLQLAHSIRTPESTRFFTGRMLPALQAVFGLLLLLVISSAAQAQNYRLGPGDMIGIAVYGEPDLTLEMRLGDSGIVNFPFIGELSVNGRTTAEVEELITTRLVEGEYLLRPDVTVNILGYRSFYISGQVAAPGSYPFEPGLTLRKAISIAGGFTERASRSNIDIISGTDQPEEPRDIMDRRIYPDDIITVNERFF